jgi:adenosylcobinamide-GDP ribazoletransferase
MGAVTGLWLAMGFLTAVPTPRTAFEPNALGRAAAWFPLVGLGLGLLLAAAHGLLHWLFPPLLAAGLLVALWAALTGGLHLDGLADCGDGLLSAASAERRLEIMRDPRLGAFGGISLMLFLMLKVLAVANLATAPSAGVSRALLASGPLVLAAVTARWLVIWQARQPAARPAGMGASFARGITPASLVPGALIVLTGVVLFGVALGGARAAVAVMVAAATAWLIARTARARLGGVTGDVLGLTIEAAELSVLLVFAQASTLPIP